MDAPEDRDIKLQRTSADLLTEFGNSLPKFLWKDAAKENPRHPRRRVRQKDTSKLVTLLEPFQEWPQLLDPHLVKFLSPLISAFLEYLNLPAEKPRLDRLQNVSSDTYPLPRAISKLLYLLCKIRGEKVVTRFFNNEPKFLEPLLSAFEVWDKPQVDGETPISPDGPLIWEERYIMLLWLSHLLLAPFDLASISSEASDDVPETTLEGLDLPPDLPSITKRLLPISLKYLIAPSKERESAKLLLVRLALRRDMRQLGLLHSLIRWALYTFTPQKDQILSMSIYQHVGVLNFLAGVLASSDRETMGEFIMAIFRVVQSVADKEDPLFVEVRSSALARKIMIKIFRLITVMVLQPKPNAKDPISGNMSSTILEDVIDQMLNAVGDKDTPVRYASSKALSVIAAKLDSDMAAEVVEAVVGSLGEDVLWESDTSEVKLASDGGEVPHTIPLKRNLTAVNALRWHGLTLTLAHLLFRRSPPPEQLPDILNALILALGFEQRSATGSSLGTNVRDAACFGIWALSRRYTTKELLAVDTKTIRAGKGRVENMSVPQLLATELVVSASLDPSGNIRRGASAALQELIGRHPDTVIEGIKVVQVVDYHAVARRSRAITEVAVGATELDDVYWRALFNGLLDWRGTGSPDAESRRVAAEGVGLLLPVKAQATTVTDAGQIMIRRLFKELRGLRPREVEERHGLLLALSEAVSSAEVDLHPIPNSVLDPEPLPKEFGEGGFGELWAVFDSVAPLSAKDFTSSILRPELTSEAACCLVSSILRASVAPQDEESIGKYRRLLPNAPNIFINKCLEILSLSLQRSEEIVISLASTTANDIFRMLDTSKRKEILQSWITTLGDEGKNRLVSAGKSFGLLAALGTIFSYFSPAGNGGMAEEQLSIINALLLHASPRAQIETRVAAIKSLASGVLGAKAGTPEMIEALKVSLDDYTVDSRGDVGSWMRMEAIDAVSAGWRSGAWDSSDVEGAVESVLDARVARLAAEKLDKVRFKAWKCLQVIRIDNRYSLDLPKSEFVDASQTSSYHYFRTLLTQLAIPSLRLSLLEGYVISAGLGSESVLHASRIALADHLEGLDILANSSIQNSYGLKDICDAFLEVLKQNITNDRVSVPTLETTAFLFDARIFQRLRGTEFNFRSLFILVQKSHFKTGNVLKLEAAVKLYAGLAEIPEIRKDVLLKLVSLLGHPFPKVRNQVAEVLYLTPAVEYGMGEEKKSAFRRADFSGPPKAVKGVVEAVRGFVGGLAA